MHKNSHSKMEASKMSRIWKETLSPKYLHDTMGVYKGSWMPQMDRCWQSDDGFQVTSRLLITPWGKVEHAAITLNRNPESVLSFNGERDIPWATKQEIKNEIFGENRLAIEVFPKQKSLVNICDVYHIWVFQKDFELPFGIHPTRDPQSKVVNRGYPQNAERLVDNFLSLKNQRTI